MKRLSLLRLSDFASETSIQLAWMVNESCQLDRDRRPPPSSLRQPATGGGRLAKGGELVQPRSGLQNSFTNRTRRLGVEVRQSRYWCSVKSTEPKAPTRSGIDSSQQEYRNVVKSDSSGNRAAHFLVTLFRAPLRMTHSFNRVGKQGGALCSCGPLQRALAQAARAT
jgi:hypothetical protein